MGCPSELPVAVAARNSCTYPQELISFSQMMESLTQSPCGN